MGAPIPGYRALRGSLRRAVRLVVFRAADAGILTPFAYAASVLGGRGGIHVGGFVLGLTAKRSDHTAYWKTAMDRYPGDPEILRRTIESALRAGKTAEAESGLAALTDRRSTVADDARFVAGLALVYQRREEQRRVRDLVRAFLKGLRGSSNYRLGALRLSRVILAFFAAQRPLEPALQSVRNRARVRRMLDRSDVAPGPRGLLERVLTCEQTLAAASGLALLDTDVSRFQSELFVRVVRARLAAREPFSFVRIGDGEAACLPYEPYLAWLAGGDARERERIWWGAPLRPEQQRMLHRRVFHAIWSADCIGIPTTARFLREVRLRENDRLDRNLTGRGLRAILYAMERYTSYRGAAVSAPIFTSCHLHQELARWNMYGDLLHGVRGIVTVSCHPGLAAFIEREFDARVLRDIVLPPDCVSGPALRQRPADARALPDMIDEVAVRVAEAPPGSLVLVGAGYLGKWLIDVARAGGSVALDLGSIFDYWLGLPTRSYLDFPCA